jgi:hypothetical protein
MQRCKYFRRFILMKKLMLVAMFVLAISCMMMAQNASSTVDVLGAHNNQGRGCAGCHAPHSGSFGSGNGGGTDAGNDALWGQDASPLYGQTLAFGDKGRYTEQLPSSLTAGTTDTTGVLMCLSCHDGNVTKHNMMSNQAYEQKIGLLSTNAAYGTTPIPTLLGADGTTAGNYLNDHPVGVNATISTTSAGLTWTGSAFTFSGSYATFIANYGAPVLQAGAHGGAYGVNTAGKPYVVCTTCHNQHVMTIFTSSSTNQIANDGGGKFYNTYFFVNGPYNPLAVQDTTGVKAASTTQFCRQCHTGEQNESNNTLHIGTTF